MQPAQAVTPKPSGAATELMQQEASDAQRKVLQAMIEAAAVVDPTLTQRVTVAAVWQYFRLPDDSFGWSGKKRDDGTRPPMPNEAKALCILTTLSLALIPGTGQVLWLGNKAYVTADGRRYKANSDRDLVYLGRTLRPFNDGEKEMFRVDAGDMHCVVEQRVRFKGVECVWNGYGLIGEHELEWRDKYENRKAGMQSKKDCAMHLITRAERDMLNRFYPVGGLSEAPEDLLNDETMITVTSSPTQSLMAAEDARVAEDRKKRDAADRSTARNRFIELSKDVFNAGGNPVIALDSSIQAIAELELGGTTEDLNDAGDVLEAWLAEHGPKDPPPQPVDPAPKKSRAKKTTAPAPVEKPAPLLETGVAIADQHGNLRDATDVDLAFGREQPALRGEFVDRLDEVAADETLADVAPFLPPPDADDAPIDPTTQNYVETPEQKETLRSQAVAAGLTLDSDLWALSGAMKGRPMHALPGVIGALVTSKVKAKPAVVAPVAGLKPAAVAAAPSPIAPPKGVADKAKADRLLRAALDRVANLGGAPMHVLGVNPHNILDKGTPAEMDAATETLNKWTPPAAAAKPKAPAPAAATPPPAGGKRLPAYDMISRVLSGTLGDPNLSPALRERLEDLQGRDLRDGDHLLLPRAIREGKGGDFREIDELIGARPSRPTPG